MMRYEDISNQYGKMMGTVLVLNYLIGRHIKHV